MTTEILDLPMDIGRDYQYRQDFRGTVQKITLYKYERIKCKKPHRGKRKNSVYSKWVEFYNSDHGTRKWK